MLLIKNNSHIPAFNLATEEYLLTNLKENAFTLWRNEKAVIVGKNQNTISEINSDYTEKNNISVIRRLTGGGAVFHDLGNLNYTYIEKEENKNFNNYSYFTADLLDYLKTHGIKAELSGRNDILIEGKKFCGNAQCIKNGFVMHHGCILFSADLSKLSGALNVNAAKIASKGIKSVSSRVANIIDYMENKISIEEFQNGFEAFIVDRHGYVSVDLSENDKKSINKLVDEKYGTWEWNFGYSPDYNFENSCKFDFGLVEIKLFIESGIIKSAKILGDFFGKKDVSEIEAAITGHRHRTIELTKALESFDISDYISGCNNTALVKQLIN